MSTMEKVNCLRCNYAEFNSSLVIHHKDGNHSNDDPDNLIVICYNCHMAYHSHSWKLEDIGLITPINYHEPRGRHKKIQKTQDEICNDIRNELERTDKIRGYLCHNSK